MNKKRIILGLGAFAILGLTLSSCKKIETFTVTFYNGDTEVSSQTVTSGYNALVPDAPTATGKIFNGWYEDEQLTTAFDFGQIIDDNKSVYAAWVNECVVTFKDGAKTITTQTVVSGYNATVPTAPTSEGKVFNGWYADAALTTPFNFGSVINENKTIYAAWVDSTNNSGSNDNENENVTYTVTFDSNGGSDVTAASVDANGKATKPTDPTRIGFEFVCWTYQGVEYDFNTAITKSITLVAKWKAEATKQTYGFGEGLTAWTELNDLVGTTNVQNKDKTKTYAVLSSDAKLHDITFEANQKSRVESDGSAFNTQGATVTVVLKSAAKVSLEGAWGSDDPGKVYIKKGTDSVYSSPSALSKNDTFSVSKELTAGTYTISADKAIKITKLSVERTVEYCTVTYVSEQGYIPVETILEKNDKLTKLPVLNATGYVFEGWYTDSAYTTLFNVDTALTQDVTLYAKWKVYNPDDYATVLYVITPSTQEINESTVEKNKTVTLPVLNNLNGYRFDGWYEDEDFETRFVATKPITGDITLYAKFVKQIEVTYVYEDTTEIASLKFDANKAISYYPSVKSIYGKKFVGWKLNNSAFDKTSVVNNDITLVAAYEDVDTTASVGVLSSNGYEEGLYAEFMEFAGADSYNAYVKSSTGNYTKLDNQLIRKYKESNSTNTYMRVDAVGLKAGSYSLKIVPVIDGNEYATAQAEVTDLLVVAHDRSGFGFVKGTSSGAYNEDGTLRTNVNVLYITEKTKDTVTLEVVTDSKGTKTSATGLQNILNLYKKGYDSRPLDVRFIGQITDLSTLEGGDIVISGSGASKRVSCGITFEGIGNDATIDGWGLRIKNASNIEVRNLGFMNCDSSEGDDCGLQQDNDHVWVHNCDFFYGGPGGDADQAKGDGALDTKNSSYITHSYNHFWDTGKSNLQGMKSETTENYITYHHNWYDHSDSRHPRIRTCTVHIYNNYYDGNAKYGVGVTMGASAFVESNYFRNCKFPMLTSMQGSDVYAQGTVYNDDYGTFSSEAGGVIKSYGNVMVGNCTYISYGSTSYLLQGQETNYALSGTTSTEHFDAYEVASRNDAVPSSVVAKKGGTTYNNFDTASDMYSYNVQSAEDAKNTVIANAGRVQGGDFKWTFTDADDASYAVNTGLKSALTSYKTNLVQVQGEAASSGSGSNEPNPTTPDTPTTPDNPTQDLNNDGFTYTMPSTKQAAGTYNVVTLNNNVVLKYIADGSDSVGKLTYDGKEYVSLTFNGGSKKDCRQFVVDLSSYQATDTFTLSMIIGSKTGKHVYVIDSSNMGDKTKDASFKTPATGKYYISFAATDKVQLVTSETNNLMGGKIYYITCEDKVPLALIKLEKNN